MTQSWSDVLDSLAAQITLQEQTLTRGHSAPVDLEIDPPSLPIADIDRLRAIELFAHCEALLTGAATRAAANRSTPRSPYGGSHS